MSDAKPRLLPILREEAARNGYTVEELREDNRTKRITMVRQYAMWRARKETGRSWGEIGLVFKRDHTTVIYAYEKVEAMPPELRGVFPAKTLPRPVILPTRAARPKALKRSRAEVEFYRGRPCLYGHDGVRYVSTGDCVHCRREDSRDRYRAMAVAAE